MTYLPADAPQPGRSLTVEVRGSHLAAEVVPLPFYRRPRK
jgi:glycine cleavage system aminomethyltransferase T